MGIDEMNLPGDAPPDSGFGSAVEYLSHRSILDPPQFPGRLGKLNDYDILRLLGAGGMGLVFLARDTRSRPGVRPPGGGVDADSRLVAIKVLRPELMEDPEAAAYFLREVRHLQQLEHPSLLKVLAVSTSPQRPYFVMPYLRGGSLGKLIQSGGPLSGEFTLTIARQIASGLAFAHTRGIIHHDVKPGNILIEEDRRAYLSDFGLSRTVFDDTLADCQRSCGEGTAPYLSPARARGEAEDTRADVYAFGAVLYEMLTGQPPYAGATREAVLRQIVAGPPPPILGVNPDAPPALAQIAERAMARELATRYPRMGDVVADLDRLALAGQGLGSG